MYFRERFQSSVHVNRLNITTMKVLTSSCLRSEYLWCSIFIIFWFTCVVSSTWGSVANSFWYGFLNIPIYWKLWMSQCLNQHLRLIHVSWTQSKNNKQVTASHLLYILSLRVLPRAIAKLKYKNVESKNKNWSKLGSTSHSLQNSAKNIVSLSFVLLLATGSLCLFKKDLSISLSWVSECNICQ